MYNQFPNKLAPVRLVYIDNDGRNCYQIPGAEGYWCVKGRKWFKASEPIVSSYIMMNDEFYVVNKKTGLINKDRIIHIIRDLNKFDEVRKDYDELVQKSKEYEKNLLIICSLNGMQIHFMRLKDNKRFFEKYSYEECQKVISVLINLYGGTTPIVNVIQNMLTGLTNDLRSYNRVLFENPNTENLPVQRQNMGDIHSKIQEVTIERIHECATHIFDIVCQCRLLNGQKPEFEYFCIKGLSQEQKRKRKREPWDADDKTLVIQELVKQIEINRSIPWHMNNFKNRVLLLAFFLKIWLPERVPLFTELKINHVILGRALNFTGVWEHKDDNIPIEVNVILPHTQRCGDKGYEIMYIPPPLVGEMKGLIEFRESVAKEYPDGPIPYVFSLAPNGFSFPGSNGNTKDGKLNYGQFCRWAMDFQKNIHGPKGERVKNIITLHVVKKNYFTFENGNNGNHQVSEQQDKMLAINNRLESVIDRHYKFVLLDGIIIRPDVLKTQIKLAQEFTKCYESFRKRL
jgi:hypothetical protein